MTAMYTPRQRELPLGLQPCRKRSHIRGLKDLAERLEKAIDLIANDERVSSEQLDFVLWKLRVAADLLARRLAAIRAQGLEVRVSGPQTSTGTPSRALPPRSLSPE